MQVFKLPRPVLCIGGVLQVELLGRVQTQELDQLYYIWYLHFQMVTICCSVNFHCIWSFLLCWHQQICSS